VAQAGGSGRQFDTITQAQPKWLRLLHMGMLMSSLTIKDLPDKLLERLRRRARMDKRSMNQRSTCLLDLALLGQPVDQDFDLPIPAAQATP